MRADRRVVAQDLALALGLLALGALQVALQGSGWMVLGGVAWMVLPVALRRTLPLVAVAVGWGFLVVEGGLGLDITSQGYAAILALVLTVYSVARFGRGRAPLAGLLLALGYQWVSVLLHDPTDVPSLLLTTLIAGAPWAAGHAVRRSNERREEAVVENQRLVAERERHTRAAIAATRSDIARELHDVLGHSLAVMVMQLGAADHAFGHDPARARAALRAARSTGKEALEEVRTLVSLFRDEGLDPDLPAPRLRNVRDLVDELAAAGLDVRLDVPDQLPTLAPAQDLAAYRIVQESLTNAVRHGAGDVRVVVTPVDDHLRLVIDNRVVDHAGSQTGGEGVPTPGHPVGTGHRGPAGAGVQATAPEVELGPGFGIIGMEERARACGGSLRILRPSGRFRVQALLPLKEAA